MLLPQTAATVNLRLSRRQGYRVPRGERLYNVKINAVAIKRGALAGLFWAQRARKQDAAGQSQ